MFQNKGTQDAALFPAGSGALADASFGRQVPTGQAPNLSAPGWEALSVSSSPRALKLPQLPLRTGSPAPGRSVCLPLGFPCTGVPRACLWGLRTVAPARPKPSEVGPVLCISMTVVPLAGGFQAVWPPSLPSRLFRVPDFLRWSLRGP